MSESVFPSEITNDTEGTLNKKDKSNIKSINVSFSEPVDLYFSAAPACIVSMYTHTSFYMLYKGKHMSFTWLSAEKQFIINGGESVNTLRLGFLCKLKFGLKQGNFPQLKCVVG